MLLNILQCPGGSPTTNSEPAPNVNSAEDEELVPNTLECSRTEVHPVSQRNPIQAVNLVGSTLGIPLL